MTETQLFVIAVTSSVIVWILKFAKVKLSAGWLTAAVYAVAFGLAFFFAPLSLPAFPPFTDAVSFVAALLAWVGALLVPLSAFAGFATLVYNVLLKTVLDKYGAPLFLKSAALFRSKK